VSLLAGRAWSPKEIAGLVLSTPGFKEDWHSITCVAIALGESGGYEHAINLVDHTPENRSYLSLDLGMWQVNTYWHPDLSIADSLDPEKQIIYVEEISKLPTWDRRWHLWRATESDQFQGHLGTARKAVNEVAGTNL